MAGPHGLEVWLIGTRAELDAATAALTDAGHVVQRGTRHALTGADAGRYRLYLRLSVAAGRRSTGRGAVVDLAAERASRRPA
ncbi:hypothetical protein [Micromonospora sp. DH14]|uniref:hypothetical protein n=1 Tax=Micromonospora sp. DH14 TaxID=3040120 RepID=UPI00244112A5|nr:hypothetical protein [Micromonospora sp. DH14]MDG9678245.1 hypothetical protein [Micromonospora sp. DH14]